MKLTLQALGNLWDDLLSFLIVLVGGGLLFGLLGFLIYAIATQPNQ